MTGLLAAFILFQQPSAVIDRDDYGVPRIIATSKTDAYRAMGMAVAQDRLWQMEMSRRSAQGQLAEVLGKSAVNSDLETLKRAYTPEEYAQMFALLPEDIRANFQAYADGINQVIKDRTQAKSLPENYAKYGFEPRPWTVTDSCAIAVMMARRFGGGGAGEIRNYAVYQWLQLRPVKERALDVLDDLMWFNDPDSPTTVSKTDDPIADRPSFLVPTRFDTEKHLARLPKTGLFELAGAASLGAYQENRLLAEKLSVPFKTGSYCIVVSPRRSTTGNALLLTGPQMGQTAPSIVHEVAVKAPGLQVAGMDVPGIPGVLIGTTPNLSWGLTTAVSDIEDVFVSQLNADNTYVTAGQTKPLEKVTFTLKVKGEDDRTVDEYRTVHGPVLLLSKSSKAVYSLQSSYWKRELAAFAAMDTLETAKTVPDINAFARKVPVAFNFFFALKTGETGWRYLGYVPQRAQGLDPRFPTPDDADTQWTGLASYSQMPRVDNPSSGLIYNWNNKPVWWWPNQDIPVWGSLFRSAVLGKFLEAPKLSPDDLQRAAWSIARQETDSNSAFEPFFQKALEKKFGRAEAPEPARQLMGFTGWQTEGSVPATLYRESLRELRKLYFLSDLGNLTSDSLFEQAVQPSVILKALQGKTKFDWAHGKSADDLLVQAYENAVANLTKAKGADWRNWGYSPGTMPDPAGVPIPYSNRGTYIQITEWSPSGPYARNVVSPGVAETGPHSADQAPLARAWLFKPMWDWTTPR